MMLYRAEPNALMIFNSDTGYTAAISDRELAILKTWLQSEQANGFIERLQELTLLPKLMSKAEKAQLLSIVDETAKACAPLRSFTAPESLHIDLTTACPLACVQCYKEPSEVILPMDKFTNIIAEAKAMKVFQIALGGGEPLLLDNLAEYIKVVHNAQMACTLTSSGYQLTKERVVELQAAGINHIQISLNGSTQEIHTSSRDGYQEARQALTVLAQSKVLFGINWVARRDNIADFTNMISLAKALRAEHLNILRYKPAIHEEYEKISLSFADFYGLAASIKKVQGLKLKLDSAFSPLLCYLYGTNFAAANCGCGAGRRVRQAKGTSYSGWEPR